MWIVTTFGFFSVVQKPGEDVLSVRARVREDLERLRERLPALGPTEEGGGADYPYRARVPHAELARAMAELTRGIDYANFEHEVAERLGPARSHVYGKVWRALLQLRELDAPAGAAPRGGKMAAYGGLVLDRRGRILLYEPAKHDGGCVWTFPNARPDVGESPEQAALRAVRLQGGVIARIRAPLNEWLEGETTDTKLYLMDRVEDVGDFDPAQTASVRWATFDEARALLAKTRAPTGRARDLRALELAARATAS